MLGVHMCISWRACPVMMWHADLHCSVANSLQTTHKPHARMHTFVMAFLVSSADGLAVTTALAAYWHDIIRCSCHCRLHTDIVQRPLLLQVLNVHAHNHNRKAAPAWCVCTYLCVLAAVSVDTFTSCGKWQVATHCAIRYGTSHWLHTSASPTISRCKTGT
jgi:hypothetical protein